MAPIARSVRSRRPGVKARIARRSFAARPGIILLRPDQPRWPLATLKAEGAKLAGNLTASLDDLSPAREAIMWQKIGAVAGYLIVGMGDAHASA
jgi:hypothetical protein